MSNVQPEGYNEEERYFKEQERELLRKKQQAADAARAEAELRAKNPHWMKCPKCGQDLEEITLEGVTVDRCGGCHGIYLDAGELEQITAEKQTGFFASLRKMF